MRLLHILALLMLASCASVNQPMNGTGYATTDDGVQIHYRLLGPKDAPVIWVEYPTITDMATTLGVMASDAAFRLWRKELLQLTRMQREWYLIEAKQEQA